MQFIKEKNREAHKRFYPERYHRLDEKGNLVKDDNGNHVEDPEKVQTMSQVSDNEISRDVINGAKTVKPKQEQRLQLAQMPDAVNYGIKTAQTAGSYIPSGGIAMMLFIVLFVLFAIVPVELSDGTQVTRLKLIWLSILGNATIGSASNYQPGYNPGWTGLGTQTGLGLDQYGQGGQYGALPTLP